MSSENESYELACEWVAEQIDDELRDEVTLAGTTILVGDMQSCDCIPLSVTDCRGRLWVFESAKTENSDTVANYEQG